MTILKWKPTRYSPVLSDFWNSYYKEVANPVGGEEQSVPAVNISEQQGAFILELAAPGLSKENFNIALDKHMLTISAQVEEVPRDTPEVKYLRREFSFDNFSRVFQLPENVDAEKINAAYNNGILTIEIPKKDLLKDKGVKTIKIE